MTEVKQLREPYKDTRQVRYVFTKKEKEEQGFQLATKTQESARLEDEKKSINSSFKAKLDELNAKMSILSQHLTEGWELRNVEHEILFHTPQPGLKTVIRMDTREQEVIPMESHENTLFNQLLDQQDSFDSQQEDESHSISGNGNGKMKVVHVSKPDTMVENVPDHILEKEVNDTAREQKAKEKKIRDGKGSKKKKADPTQPPAEDGDPLGADGPSIQTTTSAEPTDDELEKGLTLEDEQ